MKALVLDDNPFVGLLIEKAIKELDRGLEIFRVDTIEKAKNVIKDNNIDMAFLDIEVDTHSFEENGLTIAASLLKMKSSTKVIFVTSYPSYALKAYEVHPFDFVVKPVDIQRLKQSAERAIDAVEKESRMALETDYSMKSDKLFIRTHKEMLFLPYQEIYFIEKINKEVLIHTAKGDYSVRWTLSELEEMLPNAFVRVHKSFLVNANKISRISEFGDRTYEIFFESLNKTAILSRYKVNDLFEVMNIPFKE